MKNAGDRSSGNRFLALSLAFAAAACTGAVTGSGPGSGPGPSTGGNGGPGSTTPGGVTPPGSPGTTPGGGPSTPGTPGQPGVTPGSPDPGMPGAPTSQVSCPGTGMESTGRRVLRRLTIPELDATVRTAFGLSVADWKGPIVPPDPASLDGFTNNVDRLTVGPDYARGAMESAVTVARLVANPPHLGRLLPCGANGGQGSAMAPCAQTFVNTYGAKLYRRPLTPAELARYTNMFMTVGRADFKVFIHWATVTMLQSPRVLYRSELGKAEGGRYRLTPHEVASALSYTFTGGPPDDQLLMAAAGGRLNTPDQIEAAARSLVFDAAGTVKPAFRQVMLKFADDWMGLSSLSNIKKDPTAFPDFTPEIQDALAEETRQFLSNAIFEEKGTPASLLTAPYTFVSAPLARYYGLAAGGAQFSKVTRAAGTGLGLLAQGSLLSVEAHNVSTSPTKRGYFVRTRVLCGIVPPPPPVVADLPPPTGAETTRQRYEKIHLGDVSCKACHKMFDSIGFAFEHLDATGRYREKEGRFDIDDSGEVTETSAGTLPFRGPAELATNLARLPEVSTCMASYMAAFAFGVSQPNASCLVKAATDELRGGMSLVDFYIRMARSEHFRTRSP
jgi:hypothetical protein